MSSPNRELAHANQVLVNFDGSFFQKLSCINPVPADDFFKIDKHCIISLSLELVRACIMMEIGQMLPIPVCGDPMPKPAVPFAKYGLPSLNTNLRVLTYTGSSLDA